MSIIYLPTFNVLVYKKNLILINYYGIVYLSMLHLFSDLQLIFYKDFIKIKYKLKNNDTIKMRKFLIHSINQSFLNLYNINKVKLSLFGIGFKSWCFFNKNNNQYIVFKIGFSKDLCIKIPYIIYLIPLKSTLIFFKSLNNVILTQFTSFLCSLKKPDPYKGKGIAHSNDKVILKIGKRN
jgi:ribosomal protein L6P/L9E